VTRALAWKELREQWLVWVAMAVAAVGGVQGLRPFLASDDHGNQLLVWVLWLVAWGSGLVSGALLLAGETEDGTQPFLDILPVTRRQLWRAKVVAGLGLLAAHAAVLIVAYFFLFGNRLPYSRAEIGPIGIVAFELAGFAFGLHGGSQAATVLGGIGRGVAIQAVIALALGSFFALMLRDLYEDPTAGGQLLAVAVVPAVLVAVATFGSRRVYCRSDWLRESANTRRADPASRQGWDESFRLAWWDARWFALGMSAVSLLATAASALQSITWPLSTALIGLACGLTTTVPGAGDAASDNPDERRQPGGRHLLVRACVRFEIALLAAALTVLVPLAVMYVTPGNAGSGLFPSLARQFRTAITALPPAHAFVYLPAWLLNGFAVGLLCGFFGPGSLGAGLLALPGGCFLATLLLVTARAGHSMDALDVWSIPAVLLALAAALLWVRTENAGAKSTGREGWEESLRLAWWDARPFALVIGAGAAFFTAVQATRGAIAWPIMTSFIGFACGLSAVAAGASSTDRPGEQRPPAGRRLFARACVLFAVALGVWSMTALIPSVLATLTPAPFVGNLLRPGALQFRDPSVLLPMQARFGAGLLNGFTVGLLCGLFVRGSRPAGLLALPGAWYLGGFLLNAQVLGGGTEDWQEWAVPVVLLAAISVSMWVQSRGPEAVRRFNTLAAATTLIATLWAATLVVTVWLVVVR
jgi:hypothetical protein